jgi:hypothetical protein
MPNAQDGATNRLHYRIDPPHAPYSSSLSSGIDSSGPTSALPMCA